MSEESEIQAEVEALRERFSDTKALYREVCALLFFRYGITPTASKLYQHVRKGSMSAPAEALAKFWEELRGKARVEIDHPDLPDALKQAAGQAVSVLWTQATDLAREELAALRVEARTEAQSAQAQLQETLQRSSSLEEQLQTAQSKCAELESNLQNLAAELEQERRAHAGSAARGEALSRQTDELKLEQSKSRQHFSAELDKGRAAIDEATSRAAQAERRALQEIDRERTARAQADKQLEQLRGKLTEVERDHHAKVLEANAAQTRLAADLESARASLAESARVTQLQGVELLQALQAVTQHKAEADTLRALVAQFQPPPRPARKKKPIGDH
ncbi:plasmid replication DNA-binding protein KfrA [Acidovorax sp. 56]|uniref:DNA-binding protein n=1 Tax=Acidovorax sp. 56 TaxID=2035205 RepID=UPI000C162CF1|nr:DNA-binding protein [Acidovorax sp. 56]PIF25938.1 plasmid replication DNA-binding protein KfrA [Acidovorax sp. 56]